MKHIVKLLCAAALLSAQEADEIIMDEVTASDEIVMEEVAADDEIVMDEVVADDEIVMDEVSSETKIEGTALEDLAYETDEIEMEEVSSDEEIEMEDDDEFAPIEVMPAQTGFTEAEYPEDLQKAGVEGVVRLQLLVSDSGVVDSSFVVGSLEPRLDSLAREASLKFTFSPAIAGGEPVPVYIEYEYLFSLQEVAKKLTEYVNFTGVVIERGTRKLLADVPVFAIMSGSEYPSLSVPKDLYLEQIGSFEGQQLEDGVIATTTDSLGQFQFKSLPAGEVTIKIPHSGYEMYESIDTLAESEALDQKLYLQKLSYDDYTVTSYYKGEEKEVSRRQISVNEIKKVAGLGGDAVKVVQAMPGVARPSFGSGEVVVRGSYTWDSKFHLDGIPIPSLYHFGGLKSTYNSEAMSGLDFYPGGFGSTYGNAVGGIVDIKSRTPYEDRIHGKIDVSSLDASFRVDGPIVKDKLSFLASARRSYFGELLNLAVDIFDLQDDLGAVVTPFYWDFIMRLDVTPNDKHRISISSFGSSDSLAVLFENMALGTEEVGEATDQIRQKLYFNLTGVSHEYKITDKLSNKLSLYSSYRKDDVQVFGFFRQKQSTHSLEFRNNLNWKIGDKLTMNVGTNGYVGEVDLILNILDVSTGFTAKDTINDWDFSAIGAYLNLEWQPNDRLLIIPGIRYDYFGSLYHDGSIVPEFWNYGDWNNKGISGDPSFRITSRFKLKEGHILKGAIGNYNQEPKPQGQAIHPEWGNPQLPSTKASHLVGGYEWDITDLLSLDAQGYFNYQWDIPRQTDSTDADGYESINEIPFYLENGKGRSYGLELMLRHHQSERFFGWIAYTLSRSERWNYAENEYSLFNKDQTHNFQFVGSWRLPRQWEVGTRIRYTTGNPATEIYPANGENGLASEDYITYHSITPKEGPKYGIRLNPFFQIDFRVEKKIILKNSILTPYLDIQNLSYFVYKSPEVQNYDDFYIDEDVIAMPIIPALGVSWEF